ARTVFFLPCPGSWFWFWSQGSLFPTKSKLNKRSVVNPGLTLHLGSAQNTAKH
ncbi:hypothetical protein K474DRAFT_1662760, partial [Panus rudis PR-1116 ss-1]